MRGIPNPKLPLPIWIVVSAERRGKALPLLCTSGGTTVVRGRANMAHIRQSRPESGLGFQVTAIETIWLFPLRLAAVQSHRLSRQPPPWEVARTCRTGHTVEYDPFIKSQLASTQLTLGPYLLKNSSRPPPKLGGAKPAYSTDWRVHTLISA